MGLDGLITLYMDEAENCFSPEGWYIFLTSDSKNAFLVGVVKFITNVFEQFCRKSISGAVSLQLIDWINYQINPINQLSHLHLAVLYPLHIQAQSCLLSPTVSSVCPSQSLSKCYLYSDNAYW